MAINYNYVNPRTTGGLSGSMNLSNSYNTSTKGGSDQNIRISKLFANTKDFKDVTKYNLMRGVPDFGSLIQFNPFETGYACFIICEMPKFMEALAAHYEPYNKLVENWKHIVEYEFKSFSGLQDLNASTMTIGDDLNNINLINRVEMQGASEFTLSYTEKSGSPLTKFAKLYMTGIKDPRTQVKTYHGLIHSNEMEPGFENEVFTFLYIVTDNTMREIEAAYLLIGCQLINADTEMYNYTKNDIDKRDIELRFTGYPITSSYIEMAAQDMMDYLLNTESGARQIIVNSMDYNYTGTDAIANTLTDYGASGYPSQVVDTNAKYLASSYYAEGTGSTTQKTGNTGG